MRHVISLAEFDRREMMGLVESALAVKADPAANFDRLRGFGLLLLFQKTSTRTNLSFQSAICQLGGYAVYLDWNTTNFSISPQEYEIQYASRNCHIILARMRRHADLIDLAANSQVPVINGCCDRYHPSQALGDIVTIYETVGTFADVSLAYVGVHNNVTNSLIAACLAVGLHLVLVTPLENEPSRDPVLAQAAKASGLVRQVSTLAEALDQADFVYTDTWIDMEFFDAPEYREERERRMQIMSPLQINRENLGGRTPYVMHDMPIHPGYEISSELVADPKSIIYRQAENRLYAAKALLLRLLSPTD